MRGIHPFTGENVRFWGGTAKPPLSVPLASRFSSPILSHSPPPPALSSYLLFSLSFSFSFSFFLFIFIFLFLFLFLFLFIFLFPFPFPFPFLFLFIFIFLSFSLYLSSLCLLFSSRSLALQSADPSWVGWRWKLPWGFPIFGKISTG